MLFRERVGSGRGLGLSLFLVNAAMRAQGGSVRLEERRPRAAFVLAWPRRRRRRRRKRVRAGDRQRVTGSRRRQRTCCGCATRSSRIRLSPRTSSWPRTSGLPPERVVRFDMNTHGGGPLPAVVSRPCTYDPRTPGRVRRPGLAASRRPSKQQPGRQRTGSSRRRADELIRLVSGMTVGPGDSVVIPTPTFAMFAVEARLAGAAWWRWRATTLARAAGDPHPRGAERSGAGWSGCARQTTPPATGTPPTRSPPWPMGSAAVVVVDTVYQEMAEVSLGLPPEGASLLPLQDRFPNLLILRSLASPAAWPAHGSATWWCPMSWPPVRGPLACRWPSAAPARRPPSLRCRMHRRARPAGRDRRQRGDWRQPLAASAGPCCHRSPTSCWCGRPMPTARRRAAAPGPGAAQLSGRAVARLAAHHGQGAGRERSAARGAGRAGLRKRAAGVSRPG